MSPSAVLKNVKKQYPELEELPKAKLRLVEKALVYATKIALSEDLLSEKEHNELIEKLGHKKNTPAGTLKAYRLRSDLTQEKLAAKSGVSQANISAMEQARRPIGLKVAKILATILKCDYKKLI